MLVKSLPDTIFAMAKVEQLYGDFQPQHYTLAITPDLKKMHFAGNVTIIGKLSRSLSKLRLHGRNLSISAAEIKQAQTIHKATIKINAAQEQLELSLPQPLKKGSVEITIAYTGQISDLPHGLYRSSYKEKGRQKYLLASQFEAVHARNLLPCIDEPRAKAVFQLSVTIAKDLVAVSNTLPESEKVTGKLKTVTFKPTPRMSTYLLAVITGDWRFKQTTTKRGTIIRTYAIPSQIKHAAESLRIAKQALEFYEVYFGYPYPLENLNQIAIPDMEPGVGAMENWGCVVYRADSLLIDPTHTSQNMRIYNTIVITHELAHMWFGNLVTMAWWDDLWLNEGFAAWIEYKAADAIHPDWQIWREFISTDMVRTLHKDSYSTTHPVYARIEDPNLISEAFDDITYRKGSSSIRMLEHYLGAAVFRKGIAAYMKTFAYANATRSDLWQVLERVSGKPVKKFMSKWLEQAGHPVVSYERKDSRQLKLTQKIFRYNATGSGHVWPVPIQLLNSSETYTLDKPQANWQLKKNLPSSLKLNADQGALYRVQYTTKDLAKLQSRLRKNTLPALDTIGLIADTLDLTVAGYYSVAQLLDTLRASKGIAIAEVWDQIASSLGAIRGVFGDDTIDDQLKPYVHELIRPLYPKFKWTKPARLSHNDKNLRLIILGLAARYEYKDAPIHITRLYRQIKAGRPVEPDLREIVLITIARNGTLSDYNRLWRWHRATPQTEEQRRLAAAMTNFKQPALAQRSLKHMRSSDVRAQDAYVWFIYLLRNRHTRTAAWKYFKKEWSWLQGTYGRSIVMSGLVEATLGTFSDLSYLTEAQKFFTGKNTRGYGQGLRNGLDVIKSQSKWKKRDKQALVNYLKTLPH